MKKLGEFLLAKDINAIIVAFVCAIIPFVLPLPTAFIASIIVGLVTLQKGVKSGFWVLLWVALPAIAWLALRHFGLFDISLLRCIAIWAFAALLRRYHAWGLLLEVAALVGIAAIAGLHMFVPNLQHWWVMQLTSTLKEVVDASHWKLAMTPTQLAHRFAPFASGAMAFIFIGGTLLQLVVARWWQSILVNPGGFGKEFIQIRVGKFFAGLGVLFLLLAILKLPLAADAFPVVLLPFFVVGLSMFHWMAADKKGMLFLLILVYAALFFLPVFVVFALAVIGFVDCWFDFRERGVKA